MTEQRDDDSNSVPDTHSESTPTRRWRGRIFRWLFLLVGMAFLAAILLEAADDAKGLTFPSWQRIVAALALALIALGFLYASWRTLLPDAHGPRLASAFYLSQLGKYIPGAVWQAVAQAGLTTDAGVGLTRAATYVPVHVVAQAAAGGTVGALVGVVHPDLDWPVRVAALAAFSIVVALNRRVTRLAVRFVAKVARRPGIDPELALPPQTLIVRSYLLSIGTVTSLGALYATLFAGVVSGIGGRETLVVVASFALAWTAGYLVVPLPSGVGVREAVLVITLSGYATAGDIVATSVFQRLAFISAELTMIVASNIVVRAAASGTPTETSGLGG
jgi:hypothetical protein